MPALRRVAAIGVLILAMIGLTATTASASGGAVSPDLAAYAYYYSSVNRFVVSDELCDGRYVYVHYGLGASVPANPYRWEYHGGCGTSGQFSVSGTGYITWRVCTNYVGGPDSCSRWRTDSR
jgi:hypothetical protein